MSAWCWSKWKLVEHVYRGAAELLNEEVTEIRFLREMDGFG